MHLRTEIAKRMHLREHGNRQNLWYNYVDNSQQWNLDTCKVCKHSNNKSSRIKLGAFSPNFFLINDAKDSKVGVCLYTKFYFEPVHVVSVFIITKWKTHNSFLRVCLSGTEDISSSDYVHDRSDLNVSTVAYKTSTLHTFYKCLYSILYVLKAGREMCSRLSGVYDCFSVHPERSAVRWDFALWIYVAPKPFGAVGAAPHTSFAPLCSVRKIFQAAANTRPLFQPFFPTSCLAVTRVQSSLQGVVSSGRWISFAANGVVLLALIRRGNKEKKADAFLTL
jgi:hypothetical protein